MAKCKNCKSLDHIMKCGVSVGRWCVKKYDSPDIERERNCDKYVPMTNADRIRNMTDEELAEILFDDCREVMDLECCPHIEKNISTKEVKESCKNCILEWLKSEVEDK